MDAILEGHKFLGKGLILLGKWVHRLSNINLDQKVADCKYCGPKVSLSVWTKQVRCAKGKKLKDWQRTFNLTDDQIEYYAQNFHCEVCLKTDDLCMDHDHDCCPNNSGCNLCVRGILCKSCNLAEGFLKSNPTIAENMKAYISKHNKAKSKGDTTQAKSMV